MFSIAVYHSFVKRILRNREPSHIITIKVTIFPDSGQIMVGSLLLGMQMPEIIHKPAFQQTLQTVPLRRHIAFFLLLDAGILWKHVYGAAGDVNIAANYHWLYFPQALHISKQRPSQRARKAWRSGLSCELGQ